VVNFTTIACRISSRLEWYKNYKNRLWLAKVIVKNKMSRFLWFTVYILRRLRLARNVITERVSYQCTVLFETYECLWCCWMSVRRTRWRRELYELAWTSCSVDHWLLDSIVARAPRCSWINRQTVLQQLLKFFVYKPVVVVWMFEHECFSRCSPRFLNAVTPVLHDLRGIQNWVAILANCFDIS